MDDVAKEKRNKKITVYGFCVLLALAVYASSERVGYGIASFFIFLFLDTISETLEEILAELKKR